MESAGTCRASRSYCAATRATSRRAVPIRRACGSQGPPAFAFVFLRVVCGECSSIDESARDGRVGIDSAVAQERPVSSHILDPLQIHFTNEDLLFVNGSFRDHLTERVTQE